VNVGARDVRKIPMFATKTEQNSNNKYLFRFLSTAQHTPIKIKATKLSNPYNMVNFDITSL
ncbi:MAG: hypothetical protein II994_05905, partial [Lachnospiraceae bacterium]|nr:hypothetical protein [Lachnospiraceae bacterium]